MRNKIFHNLWLSQYVIHTYNVLNATDVLWPFLGFCGTFFVPSFVMEQFHITVLSSLGWRYPFHSLKLLLISSSKSSSPYGRALLLCLSYIKTGNIVVLLVPLFSSVHFLCRLFHMKFKDKSRNCMTFAIPPNFNSSEPFSLFITVW